MYQNRLNLQKAFAILRTLINGQHYILQDELLQVLHYSIYQNPHTNINEIALEKFSDRIPANIIVSIDYTVKYND